MLCRRSVQSATYNMWSSEITRIRCVYGCVHCAPSIGFASRNTHTIATFKLLYCAEPNTRSWLTARALHTMEYRSRRFFCILCDGGIRYVHTSIYLRYRLFQAPSRASSGSDDGKSRRTSTTDNFFTAFVASSSHFFTFCTELQNSTFRCALAFTPYVQ